MCLLTRRNTGVIQFEYVVCLMRYLSMLLRLRNTGSSAPSMQLRFQCCYNDGMGLFYYL